MCRKFKMSWIGVWTCVLLDTEATLKSWNSCFITLTGHVGSQRSNLFRPANKAKAIISNLLSWKSSYTMIFSEWATKMMNSESKTGNFAWSFYMYGYYIWLIFLVIYNESFIIYHVIIALSKWTLHNRLEANTRAAI